jgi:predicted AAA+ superfamily ATPase
MQGRYHPRAIEPELRACLRDFPAVAVLGPRQCGKSTLARAVIAGMGDSVYLDLEDPAHLARLEEPGIFLDHHRDRLVCLDEVQRLPGIFARLRSSIDAHRRPGRFLILGSASRDLIRQSSESLAGRIAFIELTPFRHAEIRTTASLHTYWLRGGFPDSVLARDDQASLRWRDNFTRTFLERDIPQLGFRIPAPSLRRLWRMCAHCQGQPLNASRLGSALGVSHTTVRSYIDLLAETFMLRLLPPFAANVKKRLVKAPRIYIRDTGILHSLLGIDTFDDLMAHPVFGVSWETLAMENIIAAFPGWEPMFYRTRAGAEMDLVLVRGRRRLAFEFKASTAPAPTRGFWNALRDIDPERAWIVAPVEEGYPLSEAAEVAPLAQIADVP